MRVVLYNPQSSASRKPVLPLSLLALGALLEGRHEYVIVDGNLEPDPIKKLDGLIEDWGASVLGMTVMPGPQLDQAVPLSRELKQRHPHITIVWGGYFPTQHYDVCLRAQYVDYVVRGHGEVVFAQLLDVLENGGGLKEIQGLAYRGEDPTSSSLSSIPHPDHLPDFPYHRVPVDLYARDSFLGRRTLPHHSSYGCPFFCSFCAVVNMVQGRWLAQSAERAARVVRHLRDRWGADAVELYDNNFFVHEARTKEFAERIDDLGLRWWGEARIDTLLKYRPATWRSMAASGLKMLFMGAEAGSDEALRRMNKGGTARAEKTLEIAGLCRSYGIVPEFSFVIGSPPDPEADAQRTIQFIRKVKKTNPQAEIIMYLYTPVPLASDLYHAAVERGFRFPETLEQWTSGDWSDFAQRHGARVPWVSGALRAHVRDFQRVLNAYYPTSTDARLLESPVCWILRTFSSWRYQLGVYSFPVELRLLQRLTHYQRRETDAG